MQSAIFKVFALRVEKSELAVFAMRRQIVDIVNSKSHKCNVAGPRGFVSLFIRLCDKAHTTRVINSKSPYTEALFPTCHTLP